MSFLNSSSTAWDLRGGRQRPLIVRYSSMKGDPSPGNSLPKRRGDYSKPWRDRKLPELWAIARETPNEGKLWVEIAKREISTASKREALRKKDRESKIRCWQRRPTDLVNLVVLALQRADWSTTRETLTYGTCWAWFTGGRVVLERLTLCSLKPFANASPAAAPQFFKPKRCSSKRHRVQIR